MCERCNSFSKIIDDLSHQLSIIERRNRQLIRERRNLSEYIRSNMEVEFFKELALTGFVSY